MLQRPLMFWILTLLGFILDNVGLHPVWLIFAMFAFGYLLGFVGLLIAVPLAAAIAVLCRFGLRRYMASPIYQGDESG
jgi:predicted PurR-regulated permease PerM